MTASRRARILVPLGLELAFALAVFAAIRATDGGRYGLGAKAALIRLGHRYGHANTLLGTCREVIGAYPGIEGEPVFADECRMRTYYFLLKQPGRGAGAGNDAGVLELYGHTRIFFIWTEYRRAMKVEGVGGPYEKDWHFCGHWPPPGYVAQARTFSNGSYFYYPPWGRYIELVHRRGPDGKRYCVIVHYGWRDARIETWLDPDDYCIHAIVRPGTENRVEKPVTELFEGVVFDAPVDDAIFDIDGDGFERLKQWIAERESARTN